MWPYVGQVWVGSNAGKISAPKEAPFQIFDPSPPSHVSNCVRSDWFLRASVILSELSQVKIKNLNLLLVIWLGYFYLLGKLSPIFFYKYIIREMFK